MTSTKPPRESLLALGKAQVDAMFHRQINFTAIDDAEFLPLVECVLTAIESHGLDSAGGDELWDYAYHVYDRACREADPNYSFEENRDLMRRYLCGHRRLDEKKA